MLHNQVYTWFQPVLGCMLCWWEKREREKHTLADKPTIQSTDRQSMKNTILFLPRNTGKLRCTGISHQ